MVAVGRRRIERERGWYADQIIRQRITAETAIEAFETCIDTEGTFKSPQGEVAARGLDIQHPAFKHGLR